MTKLKTNLALKIGAVILSILLIVTCAASIVAMGVLIAAEGYTNPNTFLNEIREAIARDQMQYLSRYLYHYYYDAPEEENGISLPERLQASKTNLRFTVTDAQGNTVLANEEWPAIGAYTYDYTIELETVKRQESRSFISGTSPEVTEFYSEINSPETPIISSQWSTTIDENGNTLYVLTLTWKETIRAEHLRISYSLAEPLEVKDGIYYICQVLDLVVDCRWGLPFIAMVSLILLIILMVYLCISAGHRKSREGVTPNVIDRIPSDLYLALLAGIVTLIIVLWYGVVENTYAEELEALLILVMVATLCAIVLAALFVSLILTIAVRIKCRTILRNTVVARLLRFIWRIIRAIGRAIGHLVKLLPLFWKAGIVIVLMLIGEALLLCIGLYVYEFVIIGMIGGNLLLIPVALYCIIQFKKLTSAASRIVSGDTSYQVDTSTMVFELKTHGETLNGIRESMQTAINEQMKSERFKTELITNVSHDIKTPLTSIINYVDLLEKEEIESESAKEYIAVLERQSARLKKLIEDLVEASKASTGNLTVHLESLDLNLLISQTIAEFEDKLAASELEVITDLTDQPAMVRADGRHMWRVLENLMSNVCKYALERTRLYISTEMVGGKVRVIMKNTSKFALNISGEELMERFARGDASRHTEGSGLGLSIAGSLVELQQGSFSIAIDGDLFKATVELPCAN